MTTIYAPDSATTAETFLWYRPKGRAQFGVAYLWKQGAFRGLLNYELISEKTESPSLRVGFGLQGIATGNPGFFATSEKKWVLQHFGLNAYVGLGYRTNENHLHALAGGKISFPDGVSVGFQSDGHERNLFLTWSKDLLSIGFYWINLESPAFMISLSKK